MDPRELTLGAHKGHAPPGYAGLPAAAPRPLAHRGAWARVCWPGFIPEHFVLCGAVVNGAVLLVWGSKCALPGVFYTDNCAVYSNGGTSSSPLWMPSTPGFLLDSTALPIECILLFFVLTKESVHLNCPTYVCKDFWYVWYVSLISA